MPHDERDRTPVMLLATAGLRLMSPFASDALLEACRGELRHSSLVFHDEWAYVVTGQEEGVFAWIAANYATGALHAVRSALCFGPRLLSKPAPNFFWLFVCLLCFDFVLLEACFVELVSARLWSQRAACPLQSPAEYSAQKKGPWWSCVLVFCAVAGE